MSTLSIADPDVLVVGAGPTGLTLSLLLRRLGVRHRLVDKAAGPSTTSKALGLQHRVSELLSWLGLFDRFAAEALRQVSVNLYADGKRLTRLVIDDLGVPNHGRAFAPTPLILPQSRTEALLGNALGERGGAVEWHKELVAVTQDEGSVHAGFADGERVTARYLVSCEGAHSVARKQCGIEFEGKTYPHDFLMADVAMDLPGVPGDGHSWMHPDGVVSAIPMPGPQRWRLFIEAGTAAGVEPTLANVTRIFAERTGNRTTRVADPTWLTRFRIHSRLVDRFRAGRVFVAGDAAHLHSPSGGQGITTGMQDAYNLAWKLAQVLQHAAPPALLDTYDEERRPAARAVLATTDGNTRIFFANGRIGKALRNHLFMPLLGTRPVRRRLFRKLSQLDAHHRDSSLSCTIGKARLRAGERAPDVELVTSEGTVTLFALLGEGRPVALLTAADGALGASLDQLGLRTCVVSPAGDFARLYGARAGELRIVRPDGYLGLVAPLAERAAIGRWLARLYAAPLSLERGAPSSTATGPRAPMACPT